MNNLGIMLGGAVDQRNRVVEQGLQERTRALQERQFQAQQNAEQFQSMQSNLQGLVDAAVTQIETSGVMPEATVQAFKEGLAQSIQNLNDAGRTAEARQLALQGQAWEQTILSAQGPADRGRIEAEQEIERINTLSGEFGEGRVLASEFNGGNASPANFAVPGGGIQVIDLSAPDAAQQIADLPPGSRRVSLSVQGTDLSAIDPATSVTPDDVSDARERLSEIPDRLEQMERALDGVRQNPNAVGVAGALIENLGGLVAQLPGGTQALGGAGVDVGAVQQTRSDIIRTVSQSLEQITGEESGRYTDTERRIAERALASLDATSSFEQVQATLQQTIEIERRAAARLIDTQFVRAEEIDLASEAGQDRLFQVLVANGYTEDQAISAILDVMDFRGIDLGGDE